jgi:signal transduction histidine kinase
VAEALETIEHAGRSALDEMRRLLGLLRDDDESSGLSPRPRLANVDELAARLMQSGLRARVHVEGEPVPLESGLDLSAYRVVQEALTNSLKHGAAAIADVRIRYGDRALEVEVVDGGTRGGADANGGGRGLLGMRERVAIYGGTLEHGPRPEGGFRVRAVFPLEPA